MFDRTSCSYRLCAPMLALGLAACAGAPGTDDAAARVLAPTAPNRVITTQIVGAVGDRTPNQGELEVCKDGDDAQFDVTPAGGATVRHSVAAGTCRVVFVDRGSGISAVLVTVTEVPSTTSTFTSVRISSVQNAYLSPPDVFSAPVVSLVATQTAPINEYKGTLLEFLNTLNPPPPPPVAACDFITFGRLVTTLNGQKVVVSGNAGGNQPGGGILAEFHVNLNGTDNHVADIDSYGPITDLGPLSGLPNARIVKGTAKNGVAVELRLFDGGEPGKKKDRIFVSLDNGQTYGEAAIDQGNMQYHANCRGPKS